MKWRSADGCRQDRQERKKALVNVPRKAFAWLPVETCNGHNVWLQSYWKMYVKAETIFEYNYESLEAAERAKR